MPGLTCRIHAQVIGPAGEEPAMLIALTHRSSFPFMNDSSPLLVSGVLHVDLDPALRIVNLDDGFDQGLQTTKHLHKDFGCDGVLLFELIYAPAGNNIVDIERLG